MKVGLVCPYDMGKPGGVQSQVRGLARALRSTGDQVAIIAPGPISSGEGFSVGGTVSVRGNRSRVPIALGPLVGNRVKKAAGDLEILHVHEPLMPMVSLAALRVGPPVVATFHAAPSALGRTLYRFAGSRLRGILGSRVRRVTAVSRTAARALPSDMTVGIIPNGIDAAAFAGNTQRVSGRIVFLGRDEKRKGLDVLLEAWDRVSIAVPRAELVVMGADRGLPGVTWMGPVDDNTKSSILSSAQIYVAPNLGGESFGIVVLEGMAAGAAVVASGLRAFREVGGEAVVFFETGNAHDLAGTLVGLLEDENRCSELSGVGRARAAGYDWSVVAAEYRALYQEALS